MTYSAEIGTGPDASTLRRVIAGASIGNAAEWFDFAIYGFLATYIAANFFPAGNDTAALLNTFAIFAAGILGRRRVRRGSGLFGRVRLGQTPRSHRDVHGVVGLYIRLRLDDIPDFKELSATGNVSKLPLREAVQTSWRPILQVTGVMIIFNVGYYVVFTFLPAYFIKTLHFDKGDAFLSVTLATLLALILTLPLAALPDRIGLRPLLIAGALAPAFYIVVAAAISLLTVLTLRETAGRPLLSGPSSSSEPRYGARPQPGSDR